LPLDLGSLRKGSVGDTLAEFIENAHSKGVAIISAPHNPKYLVPAGLLFSALSRTDITAVFYPTYALRQEEGIPTIVFGASGACSNCVEVLEGGHESVAKKGGRSVVKVRSPAMTMLKVLEEVVPLKREVKYVTAATILLNHLPRAKSGGLREWEEEALEYFLVDNTIARVGHPPIMWWGILQPKEAVERSIDIMIFRYFVEGAPSEVSEKDVRIRIGDAVEKAPNYAVGQRWGIRDLTELAYVLLTLADILGPKGVLAAAINPSHALWASLTFRSAIKDYRKIARELKYGIADRRGRAAIVTTSCPPPPLTPITIAARGAELLREDDVVVAECGGKYFVPAQLLPEEAVASAWSEGKLEGGYVTVPSLSELGELF